MKTQNDISGASSHMDNNGESGALHATYLTLGNGCYHEALAWAWNCWIAAGSSLAFRMSYDDLAALLLNPPPLSKPQENIRTLKAHIGQAMSLCGIAPLKGKNCIFASFWCINSKHSISGSKMFRNDPPAKKSSKTRSTLQFGLKTLDSCSKWSREVEASNPILDENFENRLESFSTVQVSFRFVQYRSGIVQNCSSIVQVSFKIVQVSFRYRSKLFKYRSKSFRIVLVFPSR